MTEVQKYLLKLVKEIDEICLANDIDYYVFAGSQLGYERNEGFLPWDDDIDLIMTQENYTSSTLNIYDTLWDEVVRNRPKEEEDDGFLF